MPRRIIWGCVSPVMTFGPISERSGASMARETYRVLLVALLLVGCTQEAPPLPPVPAAPEDLSTWSVPELVQPLRPETLCPQGATGPQCPQQPQRKPTAAEKVYDFALGETYQASVAVGTPL